MLRIFIAVPVPLDVASTLGALVPDRLDGLKRVAPELMHVTLAFVGWTDEARVPDIIGAVAAAAPAARAFRVPLEGLGRFPPAGRPRVVWAGTGAAAARIDDLGQRVRTELARRQVAFDPRPLQAHITLARVRDDATADAARAVAAAVAAARIPAGLAFAADALHVMESVLSPRGPRYRQVSAVRLQRSSD